MFCLVAAERATGRAPWSTMAERLDQLHCEEGLEKVSKVDSQATW